MKTIIKMQGTLVKVHNPSSVPQPPERPVRGEVVGFSKKSRKRLLELFASLKPVKKTVFITLTYPAEFPDAKTAKNHLRAFFERLRRMSDTACGVWRLEFQKRGAPHFHLIMWNLPFIDKARIQQMWGEVIGYSKPFTRIELILNNRKVMSYVSKYVAKPTSVSEEGDGSGFNNEPYLHAGRVWGCFNKDLFPFDDEIVTEVEMTPSQYFVLRAVAKTIFPHLNDEYPLSGFTLFVPDAYEWLTIIQDACVLAT